MSNFTTMNNINEQKMNTISKRTLWDLKVKMSESGTNLWLNVWFASVRFDDRWTVDHHHSHHKTHKTYTTSCHATHNQLPSISLRNEKYIFWLAISHAHNLEFFRHREIHRENTINKFLCGWIGFNWFFFLLIYLFAVKIIFNYPLKVYFHSS